jgi:hypothetical protein
MHRRHLGTHSFMSPQPHPRHHHWVTGFKPRQRRQLIDEDQQARMQILGILVGAVSFGLVMLVATLIAVA